VLLILAVVIAAALWFTRDEEIDFAPEVEKAAAVAKDRGEPVRFLTPARAAALTNGSVRQNEIVQLTRPGNARFQEAFERVERHAGIGAKEDSDTGRCFYFPVRTAPDEYTAIMRFCFASPGARQVAYSQASYSLKQTERD
jgi:hypothetical protein